MIFDMSSMNFWSSSLDGSVLVEGGGFIWGDTDEERPRDTRESMQA